MTLEEFNKLFEKTDNRIKEEYKVAKELWEKNDFSFNDKFKTIEFIQSENIYENLSEDCIKVIQNYREEVKNFKGEIYSEEHIQSEIDTDYDYGAEVISIYFETRIKVFRYATDITTDYTDKEFRDILKNLLKPEKEHYAQNIDCKLLTLFKEGTIDWSTLQKLVYTNCEL